MSVELCEKLDGKVLEIRLQGKLTKDDYKQLVPAVERLIEKHGKVRMLMEMHDFHGWEMGALWEDFKFDLKHFRDIDRLAMIGEKKWQKGMSVFCRPFTTAKIRYFEHDEIDQARAWLEETCDS